MRIRILAVVILAFAAFGATAQQSNNIIDYSPVTCFRAGELPLLQMNIEGKGELRAYFRRINTSDWCSVEGLNEGPLSRIVMPKFDDGDEVEYFIVVIQGRRVISRSPRIYRARVASECKAIVARNIHKLSLSCGEEDIPTSLGAGYAMQRATFAPNPNSPDGNDPGNGDLPEPTDPGMPDPPVGDPPESPFDPNQQQPPPQ